MNAAIKLNPNFQTAFHDRGNAYYDKRDYDDTVAAGGRAAEPKPVYAMTVNYRSSYENRREGDRIVQDANPPIRNGRYNAFAYSPETFPPASPPLIAPPAEKTAAVAAPVPVPARGVAAKPKRRAVPIPPARPQRAQAERVQARPVAQPLPRPRARHAPRHKSLGAELRARFFKPWWKP